MMTRFRVVPWPKTTDPPSGTEDDQLAKQAGKCVIMNSTVSVGVWAQKACQT